VSEHLGEGAKISRIYEKVSYEYDRKMLLKSQDLSGKASRNPSLLVKERSGEKWGEAGDTDFVFLSAAIRRGMRAI